MILQGRPVGEMIHYSIMGPFPRHHNPSSRLALPSQNGKVRRLIEWVFPERLTTGEAFLEAVPEADLVLAKAPAEKHLLPPSPG